MVQDLALRPSTSTVQAPHWLVSQPTCVPVRLRFSLRKWTSSVRGSTSAVRTLPLTVTDTLAMGPPKPIRLHQGFGLRASGFGLPACRAGLQPRRADKTLVARWSCAVACLVIAGCVSADPGPAKPPQALTADDIRRAPTVRVCDVAGGNDQLEGSLIRVSGSYGLIEVAFLAPDGPCQRVLFLRFDDEQIARLTPEGERAFFERATDRIDRLTVVGRLQNLPPTASGDRGARLLVYAIERVERVPRP